MQGRPEDFDPGNRPKGDMPEDFDPDMKPDRIRAEGDKSKGDRPDGGGMHGGKGGDMAQDVSVVINGGNITIDAEGDGIDSNGSLTINGGKVYVAGSSRGGNGALDYAGEGIINGGTIIAVGDSSMAEAFGDGSGQSYVFENVDDLADGGDIVLTDESGNEIVAWSVNKRFNSVVISAPQINKGVSYTLQTGNNTMEVVAK